MDSCSSSWSPTEVLPLESILPSVVLEPTMDSEEEAGGLSNAILISHDINLKSSLPSEIHFGAMVSPTVDENGSSLSSSEAAACTNSGLSTKRSKVEQVVVPKPPMSQCQVKRLGEKITALQQLVSPFGKTDTASVLLEATEYIKFLQEQVQVLSSPYMTSRADRKGSEADEDLRSKGLCLVPVSCTRNVANSNGADFWISGIRGCSR